MADCSFLLNASATKEIVAVGSKEDRRRTVGKIALLAVKPRPQKSEELWVNGRENDVAFG